MPNGIRRGHREIVHDADQEVHGGRQCVSLCIRRIVSWEVLPLNPVQWSGELLG